MNKFSLIFHEKYCFISKIIQKIRKKHVTESIVHR